MSPLQLLLVKQLTDNYCIEYLIWKIRKLESNLEDVNGGIPQGSKIGPLAFIIKINGLDQVCLQNDNNMVVIYMDDSTLSEILDMSSHTSGQPIGNMQEQLNAVTEWATEQDMILNKEKCKEMIVDFRNTNSSIASRTVTDISCQFLQVTGGMD